jgi:hypothetical protein
MAIPLLSEKALRVIGIYHSAIEFDIPFNVVYNALKKYGLSYRRQDMLRDFNILKGYEQVRNVMKYIPREKLIPESHYIPAEKLKKANFYTVFRVEGIDKITGEYKTKYVTVTHDSILRRKDLEDNVEEMFAEAEKEGTPPFEIRKMTPVRGFRREMRL